MIGKNSKPAIGILTGSPLSGSRSGAGESESKTQSPKGLKCFDFGGVGLGIVAALEKSGGCDGKIPANAALFNRNSGRSRPMPVKNSLRIGKYLEEFEMRSSEEQNKRCTRLYCEEKATFRIQSSRTTNRGSVFHISPARLGEFDGAPATVFLSSCYLCKKQLHGKDIYMYRGDKAFCSAECRYSQIVMDERKDKCSSGSSKTVEASSSPLSNGQIFTTGILAI